MVVVGKRVLLLPALGAEEGVELLGGALPLLVRLAGAQVPAQRVAAATPRDPVLVLRNVEAREDVQQGQQDQPRQPQHQQRPLGQRIDEALARLVLAAPAATAAAGTPPPVEPEVSRVAAAHTQAHGPPLVQRRRRGVLAVSGRVWCVNGALERCDVCSPSTVSHHACLSGGGGRGGRGKRLYTRLVDKRCIEIG